MSRIPKTSHQFETYHALIDHNYR